MAVKITWIFLRAFSRALYNSMFKYLASARSRVVEDRLYSRVGGFLWILPGSLPV